MRSAIFWGVVFGAIFCFGMARAEARYSKPPLPRPMPTIHWADCPHHVGNIIPAGCVYESGDVYVSELGDEGTLYHELAHWMAPRLDQGERNRLTRALEMRGEPWEETEEVYADEYADCRIDAQRRRRQNRTTRIICGVITRALAD